MKTFADLPERFRAKVAVDETGCWLWTAARTKGYGAYAINRRMHRAHRVSYQLLQGEIPEGLELDHLCRVRACVNPEHLEPVTSSVNKLRSPLVGNRKLKQRDTCPYGHPWSEENTYVRRDGSRTCRPCHKASDDRRRAERIAARSEQDKAEKAARMGLHNRTKTHCANGHAFDEANTYRYSAGRRCRACDRASAQRQRDRKRAAS